MLAVRQSDIRSCRGITMRVMSLFYPTTFDWLFNHLLLVASIQTSLEYFTSRWQKRVDRFFLRGWNFVHISSSVRRLSLNFQSYYNFFLLVCVTHAWLTERKTIKCHFIRTTFPNGTLCICLEGSTDFWSEVCHPASVTSTICNEMILIEVSHPTATNRDHLAAQLIFRLK